MPKIPNLPVDYSVGSPDTPHRNWRDQDLALSEPDDDEDDEDEEAEEMTAEEIAAQERLFGVSPGTFAPKTKK